jgi:hypothetical protein
MSDEGWFVVAMVTAVVSFGISVVALTITVLHMLGLLR